LPRTKLTVAFQDVYDPVLGKKHNVAYFACGQQSCQWVKTHSSQFTERNIVGHPSHLAWEIVPLFRYKCHVGFSAEWKWCEK